MEITPQQKEAIRRDIEEMTDELSSENQYIQNSLKSNGLDVLLLFHLMEGDFAQIGFVVTRDLQIYYFESVEDYDEEFPEEETTETFNVEKVELARLEKDKKIYSRAVVALEMAAEMR